MKVGQLIFDAITQRMDIVYRDGTFHGGLNCGNTFEVLIDGHWHTARIEYSHGYGCWYLAGVRKHCRHIVGLTVRR